MALSIKCNKAQAALEYMIVTGLALLVLAPIALSGIESADKFSRDLNHARAKDALNQISDAAKAVYFQGPPSAMTIEVIYPNNIVYSDVSNHEAYFGIDVGGATSDAVVSFDFDVAGNISGGAGVRTIYIEAVHNESLNYNYINITKTG